MRLAVYQQLIQDTQSTLEGSPPPIRQGPVSKRPDLETIPEVSSSREWEESTQIPTPQEVLLRESLTQTIGQEGIPKVDKQQAKELWEDVHKKVVDDWFDTNVSPPFSEMNLDQPEWDKGEQNALKDKFLSIDS